MVKVINLLFFSVSQVLSIIWLLLTVVLLVEVGVFLCLVVLGMVPSGVALLKTIKLVFLFITDSKG